MLNDFDYEAYQKGIIARGSKNKNRKYKNWPAAHMSTRELQKRNGETVEFNMNQPMSWEIFKKICAQSQRDYIVNLVGSYNISMTDLSGMSGGCRYTIIRHFTAAGLTQYFAKGRKMNTQQRKAWNEFLNFSANNACAETDSETHADASDFEDEAVIQTVSDTSPSDCDDSELTPVSVGSDMMMGAFTFEFSGKLDPQALAEKLKAILPENAVGNLQIICNLRSDNSSN